MKFDRGRFVVVLVAVGTLGPGTVLAYRPFDGTDASVVDPGTIEIEAGPVGWIREGSTDLLVVPDAVANLGLASQWQLTAEGAYVLPVGDDASGAFEGALLVTRILREGILQDRSGPSLSGELGLLLPASAGNSATGFSTLAAMSERWTSGTLHLTGQLLYNRDHLWEVFGSAIGEGPDRWVLRPALELALGAISGASARWSVLGALLWSVHETLSVDAALRFGRSGGNDVFEVRAGWTWAFSLDRSIRMAFDHSRFGGRGEKRRERGGVPTSRDSRQGR